MVWYGARTGRSAGKVQAGCIVGGVQRPATCIRRPLLVVLAGLFLIVALEAADTVGRVNNFGADNELIGLACASTRAGCIPLFHRARLRAFRCMSARDRLPDTGADDRHVFGIGRGRVAS